MRKRPLTIFFILMTSALLLTVLSCSKATSVYRELVYLAENPHNDSPLKEAESIDFTVYVSSESSFYDDEGNRMYEVELSRPCKKTVDLLVDDGMVLDDEAYYRVKAVYKGSNTYDEYGDYLCMRVSEAEKYEPLRDFDSYTDESEAVLEIDGEKSTYDFINAEYDTTNSTITITFNFQNNARREKAPEMRVFYFYYNRQYIRQTADESDFPPISRGDESTYTITLMNDTGSTAEELFIESYDDEFNLSHHIMLPVR